MGFELTTLVVIGTDSTGSCKFNYYMITTMTAPQKIGKPNGLNKHDKCAFNVDHLTISDIMTSGLASQAEVKSLSPGQDKPQISRLAN